MIKARRIITEAKKLINTPFCHFGRSTLGIDCSGLIWLAHTRCGMSLKRVDERYGPFWWKDSSQGERILDGFQKLWKFEICDEPVIGGLILFRIFGKMVPINHCGIIINEDEFIHAKCGIGKGNKRTVIENLQPGYAKRVACYMIHREVDYGSDDRTNSR